MKDIILKLRQAAGPLALGWLMTIWMPVPHQLRAVVATTVDAVRNGVSAIVFTMKHESSDHATAQNY